MPFRSTILSFTCGALLCLGQTAPMQAADTSAGTAAQPAARIVAGIGSAEKVLNFLEYIVVDLAGKEDSWKNNIQPNIEIFLYGVATDQPVRFDFLFDAEHGSQVETIVPMSDLKVFIQDNLEPIGIIPERSRQDRNLYELGGNVLNGWMRYLPDPIPYSVIFAQKEVIPAEMQHPEKVHKPFVERDSLAFAYLKNTAEGQAARKAAFEKYRSVSDEDFKKLSTESRDQFELRKKMRDQTMSMFEQWLVESAEIQLELNVDSKNGQLPAKLTHQAIPETPMARDLQLLKEHRSMFAGIQPPEKNILTARVNFPINAERKAGGKKVYELARPVVKERINNDKTTTAEEKKAINEIASLMLDVLSENLDSQTALDAFADIYPVNDKHAIVMAVACKGKDKLNQAVEKLSSAQDGWTVEMNTETVEDTAIHKLSFGKTPPKSLVEFYGDSNVAYIGVSDKNVWLAGGEGALEALKSRVEIVAKTQDGEGKGVMAHLQMNARPIIQSFTAMKNDPELGILKQMDLKGRIQSRTEERNANKKNKNQEEKRVTSNLASFEWQPTAIRAMEGLDDRITLDIKLNEQATGLNGTSNAQVGVLKAIGAVIAKFADENLQ